MKFEIANLKPIRYQAGVITFESFEEYKSMAQEIASYIDSLELNETNIKQVKKDLADAKKVVSALEIKRKEIKKAMLTPYDALEKQIKELNAIISVADSRLRQQVKEYEELERQAKNSVIRDIFDKRIELYPDIKNIIREPYERFLTPKHLNKTTTLKSVEAEMTDWLERVQKDIDIIVKMDDAEVMTEFVQSLDLAEAMATVQKRRDIRKDIVNATYDAGGISNQHQDKLYYFAVKECDVGLLRALCERNGIKLIKQ